MFLAPGNDSAHNFSDTNSLPDANLFSLVSSAGVELTVAEKLATMIPFTDRQNHARTGARVKKMCTYSGVRGVVTRIEAGSRDTVSPMRLGKTDSQAERASFTVRNCWFTA